MNNTYPYKYNPTSPIPYTTNQRNTYQTTLYYDSYNTVTNHTINTANFGFTCLYAPFFVRGLF